MKTQWILLHPKYTYENPQVKTYIDKDNNITLYDADNNKAWLSCENAPKTKEYR